MARREYQRSHDPGGGNLDPSRRRAVTDSRFRVIAEIGEGGMAYVQLAVAKGPGGFNKLVVLKTLRDSLSADPEIAAMFRREARLVGGSIIRTSCRRTR